MKLSSIAKGLSVLIFLRLAYLAFKKRMQFNLSKPVEENRYANQIKAMMDAQIAYAKNGGILGLKSKAGYDEDLAYLRKKAFSSTYGRIPR